MDMLQLDKSEYELIRYPQRGVCLYKCGNERYNLMVHAPEYKENCSGQQEEDNGPQREQRREEKQ